MAGNTPNLGLYKKDPVTDGNDTFNIETMLNENWDKIDQDKKAQDDAAAAHLADDIHIGTNPSVSVYNTAVQSLANGVYTTIEFDAEYYDVLGMHDPAVNNSRITCPVAGKYQVAVQINFDNNSTGQRGVFIMINGTTKRADRRVAISGTTMGVTLSCILDLQVDDYIEIQAYQDSGVSLNTMANCSLSVVRIG